MRVDFSDLSVNVEGHLTETEPKIYDKVHLNYSIRVKKGDEEKVLKAVKLSKEKYCGVSKMFESFAKVTFDIKYL